MRQYWEVWFRDGEIVTSDNLDLRNRVDAASFPNKRVGLILQPGAYARVGWQDRLYNCNHLFFRTDLDCWTEHDEASCWALEEMKDHAYDISVYRQGKFFGSWTEMRRKADQRLEELTSA